jgi:hypothetical protein
MDLLTVRYLLRYGRRHPNKPSQLSRVLTWAGSQQFTGLTGSGDWVHNGPVQQLFSALGLLLDCTEETIGEADIKVSCERFLPGSPDESGVFFTGAHYFFSRRRLPKTRISSIRT